MAKYRRFKVQYSPTADIPVPKTKQELDHLLNSAYNEGYQDGWEEGFYEGQDYSDRSRSSALD